MSASIADQLRERRAAVVAEAEAIAGRGVAFNRELTETEQRKFDELVAEAKGIDERAKEIEAGEKRGHELADSFREATGQEARNGAARHPLAYTSQALTALQGAIDSRSAGRFVAADTEQRAALVTTTYGAPRAWGANVLSGPRLLHVAAGVPSQPTDAVLAQFPQFTLPTASASVGENVTLAEFATATAGSVTLGRFGRWTDISREGGIGTSADAIVGMHQIGIAKDLDSSLIGAVNTAAGAAVAFTADVPAAIRSAQAKVLDATAADNASDLVVLVHPDNAALLQSVTPTGGQTIAESFQNFSGALVYPSSAVPTGFMIVANLRAGVRYFEAQGVRTETDSSPKTGTLTIATSVIGGYGIGLAAGFAVKVDVVTP